MTEGKKIDPFSSPLLEDRETTSDKDSYVIPNIESKLSARKRQECREIVKEIKDFGVSQRQLLYTIYLLSLELENMDAMRALTKVIGEVREQIPVAELSLDHTQEKKLVTDATETRETNAPPSRKKLIV